ncbi:MAG: metallophosphoesterase [Fibrobacteria bacterium]|nr:metallophosphoesterase [Fibrobacteria bacterium]
MIWRYLAFFAVVLGFFGGAHVLSGMRLTHWFHLQGWTRSTMVGMLTLLGSVAFLGQIVARRGASDVLVWVSAVWMGSLLLLLVAVAIGDVVGFASRWLGVPASGVVWIRSAVLVVWVGTVVFSIRSALSDPRIHEVEVRIRNLPRSFEGYRIAHVTDTHLGPILRGEWMGRLAARVDSAATDLVVHTGDLVDGAVSRVAPFVAPWGALRGRDGALFVTGNHDVYSDSRSWSAHVASLGVTVLRNQHVVLARGNDTLVVGGIPDLHDDRSVLPPPDGTAAFAGAPSGPRILLAHQPVQARDVQGLGIDLLLAGHTHGGQIWPFSWLVRLAQPVVEGFGTVGDVRVFVSRGAGFWGPPMRFLAPPEVPILVLRGEGG